VTLIHSHKDKAVHIEHILQAFKHAECALLLCDTSAEDDLIEGELGITGASFQRLIPAKVFTETALLLRCTIDSCLKDNEQIRSSGERLFALLADRLSMTKRLAYVHQKPWLAFEALAPYILLEKLGLKHKLANEILDECCQTAVPWRTEQAPAQKLEYQWMYWLYTGSVHPDAQTTIEQSCLGTAFHVAGTATEDFYAFTHCLLFLTDQGKERWLELPRAEKIIISEAEALLLTSLDLNNFDLAAELLWTWPMLGIPLSPTASFCLSVLCGIQRAYGFLPGPHYHETVRSKVRQSLQERYFVSSCYHTTLVMGMLSATLLRSPDRNLGDSMSHNGTSMRRDERALVYVSDENYPLKLMRKREPKPVWESYLNDSWMKLLVPAIVQIALRRAVEDHDVATLRACLQAAVREGLEESPMSREGLRQLQRLILFSKAGIIS
jgi:hypothetical protein